MPLARIDLRKGKDLSYRQEIGRVVYEAMIAVGVGVPANARFQIVSEHDAEHTSRGGSTWSRDDSASRV
jgi:4-oxalocrotonate tautomerase